MADPGILYPTAEIIVESPHRAFGLMLSPPYTIHDDFDSVYDQTRVKKNACYIDRNARVLMGAPNPMVMDTTFGVGKYKWAIDTSAGRTDKWHDDVLDPDTGKRVLVMDDANTDVWGRVYGTWTHKETDGYFLKVTKGEASTDSLHTPDNNYVRIDLGFDGTGYVFYQIWARFGEPFRLMASIDGLTTFQQLRYTDNIPDSEAYLQAHDRRLLITYIPVPHRKTMSIYIGHGDGDLSYTASDILFPKGNAAVRTKNGKCVVGYLPVGFPIAWSIESGSKDVTFRPRSSPQVLIWPDGNAYPATNSTPAIPAWPEGTTATMVVTPDAVFPQVMSYKIDVSSPQDPNLPIGFASSTVMLDWAEVYYPPVTYNDTFSAPQLMRVEAVQERHIFDVNNLNLMRQATLVADNYRGEWSYSSGMRAVSIARGWNGDNQLGFVGWIGETIKFTRNPDSRKATFWAFDRSFPLRRRKCGQCPPMDAWCPYAAQRFLAGRGGITEEWMQYIPYCPTGPNPRGCTHALLPMGTGSRPRMKPAPSSALWDAMNRIRALYREILGFDRFGNLRIEPWDPTNLEFYGWYSAVPAFNGSRPYLNEIVNGIETTASVADVRSEITLVGIDPGDSWSPLVLHEQNDDVIYNLGSPAFLGFPDDWVEVDPMFTSLAFMKIFADLMIQQTSIPTVSSNHSAYMQPYLHLLAQIGVSEPITLGDAIMYASELTHDYRIGGDGPISATTSIRGKAVANLFG